MPILLAAQVDPAALLQRARSHMTAYVETLPKYTCVQTIHRERFRTVRRMAAGCAAVDPNLRGAMEWRDQIKLDVTRADHGELFSWAGDRAFQTGDAADLIGNGLTGTGDFGPFVADVFSNPAVRFESQGNHQWNGRAYALYRYKVPVSASHYQHRVGGTGQPEQTLGYEGQVWIDPATSELGRMTIEVTKPPRGTCGIETDINYHKVATGSGSLLLPDLTELRMWIPEGTLFRNRVNYSSCRAFQSESVFHVIEGDEDSTAPAASQRAPQQLPPGLRFHIALRDKLDAETAFAGDPIEGVLKDPSTDKLGTEFVSVGAVVKGRVVRLEQHVTVPQYFVVGLEFNSVVMNGVEVPLHLLSTPRSREERDMITPQESKRGVGLFLFRRDRLVLGPEFVSEWTTAPR